MPQALGVTKRAIADREEMDRRIREAHGWAKAGHFPHAASCFEEAAAYATVGLVSVLLQNAAELRKRVTEPEA